MPPCKAVMTTQQRKARQNQREKEANIVQYRDNAAEIKRRQRAQTVEKTEVQKAVDREKGRLRKAYYREHQKAIAEAASTPEEIIQIKMNKNEQRVIKRSVKKTLNSLPSRKSEGIDKASPKHRA